MMYMHHDSRVNITDGDATQRTTCPDSGSCAIIVA
jgi:hypothetical protein